MIYLLFLAAIFFTVLPVHAHLHGDEAQDQPFNLKSSDNTAPFQAVEHEEEYYGCSGYIRTGYIQTDHTSASAIAGELGCGYQLNSSIKAHLGVLASIDSGLNRNDPHVQPDFFNKKQDSYLIVGEAVLTLSYQQFDAHLGRQIFDSPHMDADDLRMIANLFEAYLLDYHYSEPLYFGAGYIREASGWENGANASQFVSIGEAFGGESGGAWVSWLTYQQEDYSSEAWFYLISDHVAIFYSEFIYHNQFTEHLSFSLGLQYDGGISTGDEKLADIDAHTVGGMATLSWTDFTFAMAYNINLGQTAALASIGGGAFFTSLEDQTLDAVTGDHSDSVLLSLEYSLGDALTVGAVVAKFTASNKRDYNKEELNVYLSYNWKQQLTAEFIMAVVDDRNAEPDLHQVRAILTYRY